MATTTRRKVLQEKYNELIADIRQHTNEIIFPSLEDVDLIELIFYFNHFYGAIDENMYRKTTLDILQVKNIVLDESTFDKIYPVVFDFLVFFKGMK